MKVITTENILREMKHVEKGTVVTLEAEEGRMLIGCGRAIEGNEENLAALKKAKAEAAEAAKAAAGETK